MKDLKFSTENTIESFVLRSALCALVLQQNKGAAIIEVGRRMLDRLNKELIEGLGTDNIREDI